MLPPRGISSAHRIRTKFGRAGEVSRVEVSRFSTTTADAINTAVICDLRLPNPVDGERMIKYQPYGSNIVTNSALKLLEAFFKSYNCMLQVMLNIRMA